MQNNKNEIVDSILTKLNPKFDFYERILAFVFVLCLVIKQYSQIPVGIPLILSIVSLAMLYYLKGFEFFDDENITPFERFIYKTMNSASCIALIGILFQIQHYPGSKIMIIVGCITLGISIPTMLILNSKKLENPFFPKRTIIRAMLIIFVALSLYYTPNKSCQGSNFEQNRNTEVLPNN